MVYEEHDLCPSCDEGYLEVVLPEDCSCHIHAPCSACINPKLQCSVCCEVFEREDEDGAE